VSEADDVVEPWRAFPRLPVADRGLADTEFLGWAAIGVNKKHSAVRQRFTIAHELGQSERGANDFAAELLMPSDFVRPAFEKSPSVSALAPTFEVSELAMGYRLLNLGLR